MLVRAKFPVVALILSIVAMVAAQDDPDSTAQIPKEALMSDSVIKVAVVDSGLGTNGVDSAVAKTNAVSQAPRAALAPRPAKAKDGKTRIVVNVAVSDLVGKGVTQPEADLITEQVRSNMLVTGTFKVMERSMMDQIMQEQGFQQSGSCDNSECMVQVGRILGVQNLVVGSVGKVGRIFMMNVKIVDVSTGEVLKSLTETCECEIEQLLQETPPKIAKSLDYEVRKGRAGTIMVNTEPPGATVFLDQVQVGSTPWKSGLLDPGSYNVAMVLADWKRVERSVEVSSGRESPVALSLERSDEWIAARKAEEERARQAELDRQAELRRQQEDARRQKKLTWRVGLSALSALCVGTGYYFQTVADDKKTEADKAYERYRAASDISTMESARSSSETSDNEAKDARTMRNIAYGLGAAAFSSITFTFFF